MSDLRILVVADDPLVRTGLAGLLRDQPPCQVVGQIAGQMNIVAEAEVYRPEIILWDLGWDFAKQSAGVQTTPALIEQIAAVKAVELPIVALLADDVHLGDVWRAGVQGLLPRNATVETIALTLQAVAHQLTVIDPAFTTALVSAQIQSPPTPLIEPLTPRESEVLQQLAQGLSNKAIAQRLQISDHTVKFHVNAIMTKLNAQSRTEAVVLATQLGLILL